jgi:hypothetical protein
MLVAGVVLIVRRESVGRSFADQQRPWFKFTLEEAERMMVLAGVCFIIVAAFAAAISAGIVR